MGGKSIKLINKSFQIEINARQKIKQGNVE